MYQTTIVVVTVLSQLCVFDRLSVDVRDAPRVSNHLDRFRETCQLDSARRLSKRRASLFGQIRRTIDLSLCSRSRSVLA